LPIEPEPSEWHRKDTCTTDQNELIRTGIGAAHHVIVPDIWASWLLALDPCERQPTFLWTTFTPEINPCLGRDTKRSLHPLGVSQIQVDVSGFNTFRGISHLTTRRRPAKTQRVPGCAKILLDIMKESSDCFPFLKSTLGFVSALIKHYEVVVVCRIRVHS